VSNGEDFIHPGMLVSKSQRVSLLQVCSKTEEFETKCKGQEGKKALQSERVNFYTCRAWLSCVVPILLTIPSLETLTGRPPKENTTGLSFFFTHQPQPILFSPFHTNNKWVHITYPKDVKSQKGSPNTGVWKTIHAVFQSCTKHKRMIKRLFL
jgi:hypothetical protein